MGGVLGGLVGGVLGGLVGGVLGGLVGWVTGGLVGWRISGAPGGLAGGPAVRGARPGARRPILPDDGAGGGGTGPGRAVGLFAGGLGGRCAGGPG
ncbi:hypothetical protein ACRTEY_06505, partial [Oerskovia turbata]